MDIDFEVLRTNFPELAESWDDLQGWFCKNAHKKLVELETLARDSTISAASLISALNAMVESGMLAMLYRIRSPEVNLPEVEYDDPDKIPWDECGLVPCFSWSGVSKSKEQS